MFTNFTRIGCLVTAATTISIASHTSHATYITAHYGDGWNIVGLSEARFIPEPASLALFGLDGLTRSPDDDAKPLDPLPGKVSTMQSQLSHVPRGD